MDINDVNMIFFSPTGTTRRIIRAIGDGFGAKNAKQINLTFPKTGTPTINMDKNDILFIGLPVYAGRLPKETLHRLQNVRGNNTLAVLLVMYGNRAYEDALIELRDWAIQSGFIPIAAGAFIGEHSFSTEETPVAEKRPDDADVAKAKAFGKKVSELLENISSSVGLGVLEVFGNVPYQDYRGFKNISPDTNQELCALCEVCIKVCPMQIISLENEKIVTDKSKCILCCACTKYCTTGARLLTDEKVNKFRVILTKNCSDRKEPEIFFSSQKK